MTSICPWYSSLLLSITVAGSGSVPSRKKCVDPVLHTHKKEACSSGLTTRHIFGKLGFLDCKQKKSFPDTECKVLHSDSEAGVFH